MEHIRTTFGILEEWCVLFGNCYTCDHIRRLDRWDLQLRYVKVASSRWSTS